MRLTHILVFMGILLFCASVCAEDAGTLRETGVAALKDSQTHPRSIVLAARCFAQASALYQTEKNDEMSVEMNSYLYWCKKKMTMADIEEFRKAGDTAITEQFAAVEKAVPDKSEAQTWIDRADKFAAGNPDEHMLIAIRYFEVAGRFRGTDISLTAQDRSLNEMTLAQAQAAPAAAAKSPAKVEPVAPDGGKLPVPTTAKQAEIEKSIKDVFKEEFAKTVAADKLALAKALLKDARDAKTESESRYVMYVISVNLAAQYGDTETALGAAGEMAEAFATDSLALKQKALDTVAKITRTPDSNKVLALAAIKVADEALAADNYDAAGRIATQAETAANAAQDAALVLQAQAQSKKAREVRAEFSKVKTAKEFLQSKPDDAAACLAYGRFLCFMKADWEKGVPLLAKGSDAALKALAEKELAGATDAIAKAAIGEGWLSYAEKQTGTVKASAVDRGVFLSEQAIPSLSGLERIRVEKRIANFVNHKPSAVLTISPNDTKGISLGGGKFNAGKSFTLELWVSTKAVEAIFITKRHLRDDNSPTLLIERGNLLLIGDGGFYRVDLQATVKVNDGLWHHLAAVKIGEKMELFVDGKSQGKLKTLEEFNSESEWKLGYHTEWRRKVTSEIRFRAVRLSSYARYLDDFQPLKDYGSDSNTVLFK